MNYEDDTDLDDEVLKCSKLKKNKRETNESPAKIRSRFLICRKEKIPCRLNFFAVFQR